MLRFESLSNKLVTSYQKKATIYDKQEWDRSIEDHIIQRADNIYSQHDGGANKSSQRASTAGCAKESFVSPNSAPNDLIDLDLISGSAYQIKPKSQQGWLSSCFSSVKHVTFFPFFLHWWQKRTTPQITYFLLGLYILQVIALTLYFYRSLPSIYLLANVFGSIEGGGYNLSNTTDAGGIEFGQIPAIEVLMPIFMMFVLGFIHTQIFETKDIKPKDKATKGSWSSLSRKNSNSEDEPLYHSPHTECSSSPLSSSTCSAHSSPTSSVASGKRQHYHKRPSSSTTAKEINVDSFKTKSKYIAPKITIHDEEDACVVDKDEDRTGFSDAQVYKFKQRNSVPKRKIRRRYSDFSYLAEGRQHRVSQAKDKSMKTLRKRYVHGKRQSQGFYELDTLRWSTEDHCLAPESFGYFGGYYGNSNDSEDTVSPTTPILSIQGDEWPMVNSDENTSGEDYFEKAQLVNKQSNDNNADVACPKVKDEDEKDKIPEEPSIKAQEISANDIINLKESILAQSLPSNELKVSCSTWHQTQLQKRDLSVMDISSAIIRKVDAIEHSSEYIYLGLIFALTIAMLPTIYRMQYLLTSNGSNGILPNGSSPKTSYVNPLNSTGNNSQLFTSDIIQINIFGFFRLFLDDNLFLYKSYQVRLVIMIAFIERFFLSMIYFFLLCVAERTFKQRFLYSKYFSQITRRDRAIRSQIPYFRLHKVRNLKVWLSVRSYLRRHGPHRSVDIICSTSFVIAVCLLTCISLQMLKDSSENYTSRLICWEMIFWCLTLGVYIMRLMILGSRINQKYRSNLSVLITEQINLYLQLERKPHKKDALMLANHVLKLAVDLLKELESPYKISGFSANPYLYNITKVVVLSAFSAVLTEMLGFKLKLYKIKLIR